MTISHWMVLNVGLQYAFIAGQSALMGSAGTAWMYLGYAIANVGAWMLLPKVMP